MFTRYINMFTYTKSVANGQSNQTRIDSTFFSADYSK